MVLVGFIIIHYLSQIQQETTGLATCKPHPHHFHSSVFLHSRGAGGRKIKSISYFSI